jgi:hypothetical protein
MANDSNRSSTITCPFCEHAQTEEMPVDSCVFFYRCTGCGVMLKPNPGDCCVFCSFGSAECCPPKMKGC